MASWPNLGDFTTVLVASRSQLTEMVKVRVAPGAFRPAPFARRHTDTGQPELLRRAQVLTRTTRGLEMLEMSAQIFDRLRGDWARKLGGQRVHEREEDLATLAADAQVASTTGFRGWLQ